MWRVLVGGWGRVSETPSSSSYIIISADLRVISTFSLTSLVIFSRMGEARKVNVRKHIVESLEDIFILGFPELKMCILQNVSLYSAL